MPPRRFSPASLPLVGAGGRCCGAGATPSSGRACCARAGPRVLPVRAFSPRGGSPLRTLPYGFVAQRPYLEVFVPRSCCPSRSRLLSLLVAAVVLLPGVAVAQRVRLSLDSAEVRESDVDRFVSVGVGLVERGEVLDPLVSVRCYPYWIGYNGTATRDDVWVAAGEAAGLDARPDSPVGGWIFINLDGQGGGFGPVHSLAVAGDEFVEGDEDLLLNVYEDVDCSASTAPPVGARAGSLVASLRLVIRDDDTLPPEASFVDSTAVTETDIDQVAIVALQLDERAADPLCYPYRLAYSASTASAADAWLVAGVADATLVDAGWFTVGAGSERAVSSNLFVVGDDIAETDERLLLTVYPPVPLLPSDMSCDVVGAPVGRVVVTIVDDDAVLLFDRVDLPYSDGGRLVEGSGGAVVSVDVHATFSRLLDAPATIRYGSVARGSARDAPPAQDFESVDSAVAVVPPGRQGVVLAAAHIIGDTRPERDEDFWLWLEFDGLPSTRVYQRVLIRDDDVAADTSLTLSLEGVADFAVDEGDPGVGSGCAGEWLCLPLLFSLEQRATADLLLELRTYPGSALPGLDYAPFDGTLVRIPAGDRVSVGGETPLRLRIRRDYLVESPEQFYLAVYQKHSAGDMLAYFTAVSIVDDDGGVDGGRALWFGSADDVASCPEPSVRPFSVAEPGAQGSVLVHTLRLAVRESVPAGDATVQCRVFDPGKPVDYAYSLESVTALVGTDVLSPVGGDGGLLRFVGGFAELTLAVVGDRVPERLERLRLTLHSGLGALAVFEVVVVDYDTVAEHSEAQSAAAARIGRLFAAEVADLLADRFACARSADCGRAAAPVGEPLWPAGRRPPSLAAVLSRLVPFAAPAAVPPGASASPTSALAVPVPVLGLRPALGRLVEGVGLQGDPARWAPRRATGPSPWMAWFRAGYRDAVDRGSSGRLLETSALFLSGGVDRAVGPLRLGSLYSRALVSDRFDSHDALRAYLPDLPAHASAWHLVAPYVGYVPHARVRGWASVGWAWSGSAPRLAGLPGAAPSRVRFRHLGASVSVVALPRVALDLEGDFFASAVLGMTSLSSDPASLRDLGNADRRRLALRVGVPLGRHGSPASRLVVRVARRWDAGTDVDWLWTGLGPRASAGAGDLAATDLFVEYRYAPSGGRFSAQLAGAVQVVPELPLFPAQVFAEPSSVRRTFGASFDWGPRRRASGWSASVRPVYGHPLAALPAWWSGAGAPAVLFAPPRPVVDGLVRYVFVDGGAVSLGLSRDLAPRDAPYGSAARLAVLYARAW